MSAGLNKSVARFSGGIGSERSLRNNQSASAPVVAAII
jgi:hypothetical protein